jgi:SNF family Na+-dependent transporter
MYSNIWNYIHPGFIFTLILGIILNYNIVSFIQKKQENMSAGVSIVLNSVKYSFLLGVLILSMSQIANSTYNPFIYFRF